MKSEAGSTWFPLLSPNIHRAPLNATSTDHPPVIELIIFQTRVCGSAGDWIISPPFPSFCDKAHFLTSPLSLPPPLISRLFIRPLIHSSPAICSDLSHTPNSSFCIHALGLLPGYLFSLFSLPLPLSAHVLNIWTGFSLSTLASASYCQPLGPTCRHPVLAPMAKHLSAQMNAPCVRHLTATCSVPPFPQQPFYWLLHLLECSGRQQGNNPSGEDKRELKGDNSINLRMCLNSYCRLVSKSVSKVCLRNVIFSFGLAKPTVCVWNYETASLSVPAKEIAQTRQSLCWYENKGGICIKAKDNMCQGVRTACLSHLW